MKTGRSSRAWPEGALRTMRATTRRYGHPNDPFFLVRYEPSDMQPTKHILYARLPCNDLADCELEDLGHTPAKSGTG
jgi:hypothetical protein